MTETVSKAMTDVPSITSAPTIYVCTTCRPPGEPDSAVRPGAILADRHRAGRCRHRSGRAADALPRQLQPRRQRCAARQRLVDVCVRRPRRDVRRGLIEGARLLARAADGILPWRGRPERLKRGMIARIPPLGFQEIDE